MNSRPTRSAARPHARPRAASRAARAKRPVAREGALPHLPGAWLGSEAFEGAAARLAETERYFCVFDEAPLRCARRDCRQGLACLSDAPAGEIHRLCGGRPGPHVRQWVLGLWIARLHDLMRPPEPGEEDGAPPFDALAPAGRGARATSPCPCAAG